MSSMRHHCPEVFRAPVSVTSPVRDIEVPVRPRHSPNRGVIVSLPSGLHWSGLNVMLRQTVVKNIGGYALLLGRGKGA